MKAAKWIMRAIIVLVVCAIAGITVTSAVLGYKAGREVKEEKKANAKSSYEEKTADIKELFNNISIQAANDMDVNLQSSSDGKCHVYYYDSDQVTHSVYVEDDILVITCDDERTFGSDIGFGEDPYITVELPSRQYDQISVVSGSGQISASQSLRCQNLEVTERTGNLYLVNVKADTVRLASESGDVSLATMSVRNLYYDGNSGDLSVINVAADNLRFSVGDGKFEGYNLFANSTSAYKSQKGDIYVEGCDSPTFVFDSIKGDVNATLLSSKRIVARTQSGDINIPEISENYNGNCVVTTDSGDITIKYVEE